MANNTPPLKLPEFVRESLKCTSCLNYLSVSPVVNHDKGLLCGRCAPQNGTHLQRVEAYETLAQLFQFPCRNFHFGCKEELDWNLIKIHEDSCQFRQLHCPAMPVGSCLWQGRRNSLLDHYIKSHEELTIKTSSYFNFPYKHDGEINQLLIHKDKFFLFQISNNVNQGKCLLRLIDTEVSTANAAPYWIEFKSAEQDNGVILRKNIEYDASTTLAIDHAKMYSLNVSSIISLLNSNNILCKIELTHEQNKKEKEGTRFKSITAKKNDNILKELECIVCFEFMIPPIFLCDGGHSICGSCKNTKGIYICPTCQSCITNTRNYTLESITAATQYPCKNKSIGCKFTGNYTSIRSHEKLCSVLLVRCPFNCDWKGNVNSVIDHSQRQHNIKTSWTLSDVLFRNLRSSVLVDYYLVKYDKRVFKVGFKHDSVTGPVYWVVQELGRHITSKPEYKFTLTFMDQSKMNRQFVINDLCYGIDGASDFCNCTVIPYQLLTPYINQDDLLIFRLNIEKILFIDKLL